MSQPQTLQYLFPTRVQKGEGASLQLDWGGEPSPFGARRELEPNGALNRITLRHNALSSKDCARVIALGESAPPISAALERGHSAHYRTSTVAWIEPTPDTHWLFHRLGLVFLEVNRAYGFELVGFAEALQFTVYHPGDHFDWHMDLGPGSVSGRKLTVSVLLSADGDYEGGDLEFLHTTGNPDDLKQGTAVFFPSYMAHRVAPVTRGIRRSLVAWAYGPTFR